MGKIIRVLTIEEILNQLNSFLKDNYVYRGISRENEIFPQIIRNGCADKEFDILREFEQYYGIYASASSCWDFYASAQHHGLMTRLIDFSSNPYVALFFSLHEKPSEDVSYKIYCINKSNTKELLDQKINNEFFIDMSGYLNAFVPSQKDVFTSNLEFVFNNLSKENKDVLYTFQPNYADSRLLAQLGLFIFPTVLNENLIKKQIETNSTILEIDASLRNEGLLMLQKMGYSEFSLMPDLDSACREINEQYNNK